MWGFFRKKINDRYHLKTERIEGHLFSWWETPFNAPYIRVLAYFQAQHETTLGVGEDDLRTYIRLLREAINSGQLSKAGAAVEILEAQMDLYASWRNIFRMGNALILVDDEPLKKLSSRHTDIKLDLCEKVPEVRAFFLRETWATLTHLKLSTRPTPPSDYLKSQEVKRVESLFMKYLEFTTSINT